MCLKSNFFFFQNFSFSNFDFFFFKKWVFAPYYFGFAIYPRPRLHFLPYLLNIKATRICKNTTNKAQIQKHKKAHPNTNDEQTAQRYAKLLRAIQRKREKKKGTLYYNIFLLILFSIFIHNYNIFFILSCKYIIILSFLCIIV